MILSFTASQRACKELNSWSPHNTEERKKKSRQDDESELYSRIIYEIHAKRICRAMFCAILYPNDVFAINYGNKLSSLYVFKSYTTNISDGQKGNVSVQTGAFFLILQSFLPTKFNEFSDRSRINRGYSNEFVSLQQPKH